MNLDNCVRCGSPHTYDETRGWRHPDGHAYLRDVRPQAEPEPANVNGWTPAAFGMLARCPVCSGLTDNRRNAIDAHEAWHAGQTVSA